MRGTCGTHQSALARASQVVQSNTRRRVQRSVHCDRHRPHGTLLLSHVVGLRRAPAVCLVRFTFAVCTAVIPSHICSPTAQSAAAGCSLAFSAGCCCIPRGRDQWTVPRLSSCGGAMAQRRDTSRSGRSDALHRWMGDWVRSLWLRWTLAAKTRDCGHVTHQRRYLLPRGRDPHLQRIGRPHLQAEAYACPLCEAGRWARCYRGALRWADMAGHGHPESTSSHGRLAASCCPPPTVSQ